MRRLVFVFPAVLAFMFVLIAVLQGPNTAVGAGGTCQDRLLPSSSFTCTVQDSAGHLSPDMTLDFASGGPGDFHVLVNKDVTLACVCKSVGSFHKPKLESSIKFRCVGFDNTSTSKIEGIDYDFASAEFDGRPTSRGKKIAAGGEGVDKNGNTMVYDCDAAPPMTDGIP
ncbi:MAG: hypothetical protein HY268_12025 [Deltaproteobacteria bacterium]|nr:hypothetical protein [Deltaproteobacteria bacterium]